jgi:hypothetical protein
VPAPPASDPRKFGRVADDGAVYLITADGERVVGSWQAGDPDAAFAHFGRRFDDLATEVTLMETRLAREPAMRERSRPPPPHWPNHFPPQTFWAM